MLRKIVLSNFMAHAQTELNLADGLTVLVGPNNIGKSTVAVALKILARNTNSNFVMQHEQKECSITVETSEGNIIQWIKRKSPSYVINGQAKDRLGRGGTPPELDETLRLAPVEFEDKDFEPHFGDQKSPIFLINRPPSQIAQFFSTTSDAEKLVAMQRLHQRHRSEAQTLAKLLSAKNEAFQLTLEALESLPSLESEFASLESEAQSIASLESEIANLEGVIRIYAQLSLEQQMEMHRASCLERLSPVPALHSTEHLAAVAAEWKITAESHSRFEETTCLLRHLASGPKLQDEQPLIHVSRELSRAFSKFEYCQELWFAHAALAAPTNFTATDGLHALVDGILELEVENCRLKEINHALEKLKEAPSFVHEESLEDMIRFFGETTRDQMRLNSLIAILRSLDAAPSIPETNKLSEAIIEFEKTNVQLTSNQSLLAHVQASIVALETDAEQWLSSEPTCDTCGAKLSADSIRFKMHQHGS